MSLYGKTNVNQGEADVRLPIWLLALSGYFAVVTLTNKVPALIDQMSGTFFEAAYIGFFIGSITGLLSVVALLLFAFRRYVFCVYFLIAACLSSLSLAIASVSDVSKNLGSYYFSLQGLDSIPEKVFGWLIGWNHVSDPIRYFLGVAGPVTSIAFCISLLYFHMKLLPKTLQPQGI